MAKLTTTLFILVFTLLGVTNFLFAQEPKIPCYHNNDFSETQTKSFNMTPQEYEKANTYDIHFYALDLKLTNLSTDIDGTVDIHAKTKGDLDTAMFELHSVFNITDIRLNTISTPFIRNGSILKVPINLSADIGFVIAIDYNAIAPSTNTVQNVHSGLTNTISHQWDTQVTWTHSEPFSAYEWFPCKQDLRDKADSVSINITVPNNCKAGSNGVLENIIDLGNGTSRYEWFHRHPISYYLISVAVGNYAEYNIYANPTGSSNPVLIQNYIFSEPAYLVQYKTEIDKTVDYMELFANLYGKYPFDDEKYGHCIAPDGGGMEHQTMTTQSGFNDALTSHELAHQWWGNSVTCASWSDIWINEGFAQYSTVLMYENLYSPGYAASEMDYLHQMVIGFPYGSIWVEDSLNKSSIFFGVNTYYKGAAFVHTLRFMMNDDPLFFQALQNFQAEFKDSVAVGLDMRDHLEAVSSTNFDDAFNQWYFGEGYPIYSLKWNSIGDDLHFEVSHTTSSSTPTFTTPLEIMFERTNLPDTIVRIEVTSNNDQYIIPNFGSTENIAEIDPNNWIINKVGSLIKDENFIASTEKFNKTKFRIYPNPSTDIFNIETDNVTEKEISIYNSQGKKIYQSRFEKAVIVNLQEQNTGYYIVKITDRDGRQWVKTIVKG